MCIILTQRAVQIQVGTAGCCRVIQVPGNGLLDLGGENILLKKGLHHPFEVTLPFGAVRLGFLLMLVPGMQVRKLVHGGYQECIGV